MCVLQDVQCHRRRVEKFVLAHEVGNSTFRSAGISVSIGQNGFVAATEVAQREQFESERQDDGVRRSRSPRHSRR